MRKKIYCKWTILLPLILTIIAILFFIPYKQALVFQYQNTEEVLVYLPFSKDYEFKIKYTHSIHLSDVVEYFTINDKSQMKLYELEYEDFAIGMPENASGDEIFEQKNGKYYIKNMNREFDSIDMRIGQVKANHTLIYKNGEFPLKKVIKPGTWVRMKVEKINLFEQMKGVSLLE
ncbi:DUF1850 domain-containing protein [Bacillus sp. 31A1R]|uniref:DUF1850 domain-containing protein n=1 Tax=Robertmurraya mangrovi TaxID=3098077 RepID=A0ABU5ITB9_9BACI|nr:DUF1850 domain-containing protein [Bacillus sp. 31A1R]MDZ5470390.1 DUF1850 domain-containing protein [Bacillus sp. 31A1R]